MAVGSIYNAANTEERRATVVAQAYKKYKGRKDIPSGSFDCFLITTCRFITGVSSMEQLNELEQIGYSHLYTKYKKNASLQVLKEMVIVHRRHGKMNGQTLASLYKMFVGLRTHGCGFTEFSKEYASWVLQTERIPISEDEVIDEEPEEVEEENQDDIPKEIADASIQEDESSGLRKSYRKPKHSVYVPELPDAWQTYQVFERLNIK